MAYGVDVRNRRRTDKMALWRTPFQEPWFREFVSGMLSRDRKGAGMNKNTICLWYDTDAEDAARFYAEVFPNSSVGAVHHALSKKGRCADG